MFTQVSVQCQVTVQVVQTSSNVVMPECILNINTNPVEQGFSMSKVISCAGIQMER